jgi:hypothetical protein
MSKILSVACILCLLAMACAAFAAPASKDRVDVEVAGYINHGPMQPTIDAIKEVITKYDDELNTKWIDLATEEGQKYFQDHDLSAHLNVLINGSYKYELDGKEVSFQWFEGQNWTKEELDAVINDTINNNCKAMPISD